MKRLLTITAGLMLCLLLASQARAQTATPTATNTATATPTTTATATATATATPTASPTPTCQNTPGIFYNGVPQGAGTAGATPQPVGTATPVQIVPPNCGYSYLKLFAFGGTAGTDGCYVTYGGSPGISGTAPSTTASAAVNLPNPDVGNKIGDFVPTGPSNPLIYNATMGPGWSAPQTSTSWMGGAVWAECTTSGMTMSWVGVHPK